MNLGQTESNKNTYLEISIDPNSYPGLNTCLVSCTEEQLADEIISRYSGWYARQLSGVPVECDSDGYILGKDDDGEYEEEYEEESITHR